LRSTDFPALIKGIPRRRLTSAVPLLRQTVKKVLFLTSFRLYEVREISLCRKTKFFDKAGRKQPKIA
jgi:hypothetical protein